MRTNLHVSPTPFLNESRVLKQTASLLSSGTFDEIDIVALHDEGLPETENLGPRRRLHRIRLRSRGWPRNLAVQVLKYLELCGRVGWFVRRRKPDVITVHSLALLPLGVALSKLFSTALVYDCHELETETYGLSGFRQVLARRIERTFISSCDLVFVVSESIADWYREAYGLENVHVVLNCPPFQSLERTDRLREALGIGEGRTIVLYQGGIIEGRGVEGLLEAFQSGDDGTHAMVFMGYGSLEPMVAAAAEAHANIFLQPAVPPDVVLQYTASADIGVSYIDNPSLNDRYCLPNKLFEYIMAGVPALVNDAPEMRRLVTEERVGVVLQSLEPDEIRRAIQDLAAQTDLQERLAETARRYCWEAQADVLIGAHRTALGQRLGLAQIDAESKRAVTRS